MNLKGGYKILSLVTLVLIASVDGTTATDITDANTLEQLDSLKEYLDVSKQLKPILLRVKPSKEKVVMAELSRVDDVTLMIHAKLDGYELNIVVSFEQDEETLLWSIDDAQYLYVKTVTSEVGVRGLIHADKDKLSQIVYDEEELSIIFPSYVRPIRIQSDNEYYFDYSNLKLIDYKGDIIDDVEIEDSDDYIKIICSDEILFDMVYTMDYILFNGNSVIPLNSYYIYNPITSAGTKLYRHNLTISTDANETFNFSLILNNSGVIEVLDNSVGYDCISISTESTDAWTVLPTFAYGEIGKVLSIGLSNGNQYDSTGVITSITDNIYPL